jgi:hypothetical protein
MMFQLKHGKTFKHDAVYSILKKALPKYEIVLASCDARVACALFLLDADDIFKNGATAACGVQNVSMIVGTTPGQQNSNAEEGSDNTLTSVDNASCCLLITPRPTVGKKRAKLAAFKQQAQTKKAHHQLRKVECDTKKEMLTKTDERNASLARIAAAAETKNQLVQEQLMFQLFMQSPDSIASKAYFEQRTRTYIQKLDNPPIIVIDVDNNKEDRIEEECHHAADYSDDEDQDTMFVELPKLPPTQLLVSVLDAGLAIESNAVSDDTQITTLSF